MCLICDILTALLLRFVWWETYMFQTAFRKTALDWSRNFQFCWVFNSLLMFSLLLISQWCLEGSATGSVSFFWFKILLYRHFGRQLGPAQNKEHYEFKQNANVSYATSDIRQHNSSLRAVGQKPSSSHFPFPIARNKFLCIFIYIYTVYTINQNCRNNVLLQFEVYEIIDYRSFKFSAYEMCQFHIYVHMLYIITCTQNISYLVSSYDLQNRYNITHVFLNDMITLEVLYSMKAATVLRS